MTLQLLRVTTLALLLASPAVAAAQDVSSQMVGVWKRTGFVQKIVATGETRNGQGENPTGMLIFSRAATSCGSTLQVTASPRRACLQPMPSASTSTTLAVRGPGPTRSTGTR